MRNVTPSKRTANRVVGSALLLVLALSGACNPFRNRQGYDKKQVTAKEGISVLVAGTARCYVSTKEFPKIQVGQSYACKWRDGGAIATR